MSQMIEFLDKDIEISIITTLYMFKKLEERLNMLKRDIQDIKNHFQNELLETKEVKQKFTACDSQHWDTTEDKIS